MFKPLRLPKCSGTPLTRDEKKALAAEHKLELGHLIVGKEWDNYDGTQDLGGWPEFFLRQKMYPSEPQLIHNKLISIEPMPQPASMIFFEDFKYGEIEKEGSDGS